MVTSLHLYFHYSIYQDGDRDNTIICKQFTFSSCVCKYALGYIISRF